MRNLMVVVAATMATGCMHQLAPGETRCTSGNYFGTVVTDCKTGREQPTPVATEVHEEPSHASTEPVETAAETPRRVIVGDGSLYCTRASNKPETGGCFRSDRECAGYRTTNANLGECHEEQAAACFSYTVVLTGKRATMCWPSLTNCDGAMEIAGKNPDFTVSGKRCGIFRVHEPAAQASADE